MYTKKTLSIGLTAMLLLTLAMVIVPAKAVTVPAQSCYVTPTYPDPSVTNLTLGDTFTVDVVVNVTSPTSAGGTGMMGYEYKIFWDPENIQLNSRTTHIPTGWEPPQGFLVKDQSGIWSGGLKDGLGYHWYGYTCLNVSRRFTGALSLCTYNFEHIDLAVGGAGEFSTLDLQDVKIVDDTAVTFITDLPPTPAGTVQDGEIFKAAPPAPEPPGLSVQPSVVDGVCGERFNVTIEIDAGQPLDPRWDLCGWEAKLSFDPSMLTGTNSYEGSFLPGFAGPNATYYINVINNTLGIVHTGGMFLGNHTTPYGSGVLAILEFNASWQYTLPPLSPGMPGTFCNLGLYDVKLSNCSGMLFPYEYLRNATYNAPYKTTGWSLDCYTDSYRHKCTTPYVGVGPNASADAYEPQDLVIIFSELLYNQQPEMNKTVMFEITGPLNSVKNWSIYRTARTNEQGVATINFTIPWMYPNPEAQIFGKWKCFQKATVKNPWEPEYHEHPNDTLWFTVGWIVELTDVTVSDPIHKCETMNITVTYKNIMMIPKNVTLTFTVLDDLLDPIGFLVTTFTAEAGAWCHPAYDYITLCDTIHIPYWTHNGPRCRIYVNAFTALPSECGTYYCPEISTAFTVVYP